MKFRELGELQEAKELGEVTITHALERWLITVKGESGSDNQHSHSKYQTAAKQIKAWPLSNQLFGQGAAIAGYRSFTWTKSMRTGVVAEIPCGNMGGM